jgi:hypothetical protein
MLVITGQRGDTPIVSQLNPGRVAQVLFGYANNPPQDEGAWCCGHGLLYRVWWDTDDLCIHIHPRTRVGKDLQRLAGREVDAGLV